MIRYDVIVIGGGPAGATAAALLARDGHRVLVLEKERFPRFHIGESLLPCDLPVFERLGLDLDGGPWVRKAGAEFIDERTGDKAVYLFADGLEGTPSHAFQVERAAFDHALLERARAEGAAVREGARVQKAKVEADWVRVAWGDSDPGEARGRFLLDASGQDAFLARRDRTTRPLRGFGVAAVYSHFEGLAGDVVEELLEEGNIKVLVLEGGWAWLIPLSGGRLSVGRVTRGKDVGPALLEDLEVGSPLVRRLTAGTRRSDARIVRNFSFLNERPRGSRFACIGDAACFLDPVFSSGVSLAMIGAERTADVVSEALRSGGEAEPGLLDPVGQHLERAYDSFASLIHAFYHTRILEHLFFCEDPDLEMRAGLISVLAGDVWREDNRFQRALLSGRRYRSHRA